MSDNQPSDHKTKKRSSKTRSSFRPNLLILYLSAAFLSLLLLELIPAHPIRVPTAIGSGFAIAIILYSILPR
jgi:hypothetical protein